MADPVTGAQYRAQQQAILTQSQSDYAQVRARIDAAGARVKAFEDAHPGGNAPAMDGYQQLVKDQQEAIAQAAAIQKQITDAQKEIAAVDEINRKAAMPEQANLDAKAKAELAERKANGGWTLDEIAARDTHSVALQVAKSQIGVAQQNADTARAAQLQQAKHEDNQDTLATGLAAIQERLANKQIDQKQAELEQKALYDKVNANLNAIAAENTAATTIYQGAQKDRTDTNTNSNNIRTNETAQGNDFLSFVKGIARYLPKGKDLTWGQLFQLQKAYSDTNYAQAQAHGAKDDPGAPAVPQSLTDTASGKNTADIRAAAPLTSSKPADAAPAPSGDPVTDAITKATSQYHEWVAAGGTPGDWEAFRKHADAINGVANSAPASMPESLKTPASSGSWDGTSPQPAYTPPTPAQSQTTPGLPASIPQPPSLVTPGVNEQTSAPGASGVGGITINVGGQPAAQQPAPPVAQALADPTSDPRAIVDQTSLHQTGSLLNEAGIDTSQNPLLAKFHEVPPPVDAFSQYINQQQQTS